MERNERPCVKDRIKRINTSDRQVSRNVPSGDQGSQRKANLELRIQIETAAKSASLTKTLIARWRLNTQNESDLVSPASSRRTILERHVKEADPSRFCASQAKEKLE